ncbi:hypothetical protein J2X97_000063 [Epilithonimonas hungarica]|uniref:hypothetical protein n=1 Tax=Epilithonimonas hungarica TaxID=454006 RepID=UPI0027842D72|nr:hypothetical protein [Epilithonimonas hungarica]MDP9954426.1 hypothetical protein [Epilithonimonas hungarica]
MKKTIFYSSLLFSSLVFSQTGNVGINTTTPETTLDVHAINHNGPVSGTDGILVPRVNDLVVDGTSDGQLVYLMQDNGAYMRGFHYWDASIPAWKPLVMQQSVTNNNEIQVMRLGVNGKTMGTSYTFGAPNALRFDKLDSYTELGFSPYNNWNFVNSIAGSSFSENVTLPDMYPAIGLPTRTTDTVNLPAGVYEISFKIYTVFNGSNGNVSTTNTLFISADNKLYTKAYSNIGNGVAENDGSVIINLSKATTAIDFIIYPNSGGSATSVDVIDVAPFTNDGSIPACYPLYQVRSEIDIKRLGAPANGPAPNCPG